MKKRKRFNKLAAGSHVEMIIAFALFALFVTFILIYLRPYEKTTLSDTILLGLQDSFSEEVSVDLTKVFIKKQIVDCAINKAKIPVDMGGKGFAVEDVGENSFYLLVSEGLEGSFNFGDCDDFIIGSIEIKKIVSDVELDNLKIEYESNYNGLKETLDVPENVDFGVSSEDYVLERSIPDGVDVIARVNAKEVLSGDGLIIKKEFVFRVW